MEIKQHKNASTFRMPGSKPVTIIT